MWGSAWWDASQAIGTLAAVVVALGLAGMEAARARKAERERDELRKHQQTLERRRVAALVSSWVEVSYAPSTDGTHYVQRATVFVANGSDEPVFNVHVRLGVGEPPVQIGPLAVPVPIRVLPARHTRQWDVSLGMLAWSSAEGQLPSDPAARLDFSDARGVRWHKDFSGTLTEPPSSPTSFLDRDEDLGIAQLGDLSNPFNPMAVAMAFGSLAQDGDADSTFEEAKAFLEDDVAGWRVFDITRWSELRQALAGFGLAAHPWYPAPYVAYVRLVHDDDADKSISDAGYTEVRAHVLTLTFRPERGWRIFSVGAATAPDWIGFPGRTLTRGPRGEE